MYGRPIIGLEMVLVLQYGLVKSVIVVECLTVISQRASESLTSVRIVTSKYLSNLLVREGFDLFN